MPVLIERTRPTKDQLRAVYAYIRRQREKGKQALAESKAKEEEEKQRKREQEKKKETVEDVKKEIAKLEAKLEELKQKKHDLFSQFKKALNYEDEIRKQQELQAVRAAASSVHVASSLGVQGLSTGQAALTSSVQQQSALVENTSNSGVIRRQGSPPHPLSSFIQAQINHSHKIQNLQPPSHIPYPTQSSQVYPAAQERFAGFQHGQGQKPFIAGAQQPDSHFPGKQHGPPHAPTVVAIDSQLPFPRQSPLQHGGLPPTPQQQQHQQQFSYHTQQQQQSNYQQFASHGNQKQAFPTGTHGQTLQPGTAQQNQGHQQGFVAQHTQDLSHLQSYSSNVHQMQAQQSYQVHSQPQGYQAKQATAYQPQQVPMSGQHTYHPQQQQQPPQPGKYSMQHGHQVQQEQLHRQPTIATHQYQQQQSSGQTQGRQPLYEGGHQSQQMPPPPPQQQQQQPQQLQKQELRSSGGLGYSQQYTNEYQQHHPQGPQGMKKQSHRYTPYPYSGPKGHHQGGAGKKYPGKYQSSVEGTSSSGNYSVSSTHSRHYHHQSRSHKAGNQQKTSRYYQQ